MWGVGEENVKWGQVEKMMKRNGYSGEAKGVEMLYTWKPITNSTANHSD